MRKLYEIVVVNRKTDKIILEKKVAANSEADAVLKAGEGKPLDNKKVDIVIRELAELSKEPEVVHVEKE